MKNKIKNIFCVVPLMCMHGVYAMDSGTVTPVLALMADDALRRELPQGDAEFSMPAENLPTDPENVLGSSERDLLKKLARIQSEIKELSGALSEIGRSSWALKVGSYALLTYDIYNRGIDFPVEMAMAFMVIGDVWSVVQAIRTNYHLRKVNEIIV